MMTCRSALAWSVLALAAFGLALGSPARALPQAADDNTAVVPEGVEPLAHGPVHEAFAAPVTFDPQPGLTVAVQPPQAIEEVPPDEKPAGDNVVWIPGYWGWDDARENFVWISGFWRNVPPGRQWVPGYWAQADRGYQWTSGYWADAAQQDVMYLPRPPESLESGPSADAPSDDCVWVPGCWLWRDTRYAWRPGYWIQGNPNCVWVPAHYCWTPSGCVFVDGYWDRPVVSRGLLFAPCYLTRAVYTGPRFVFTPTVVINAELLVDFLFVQPRYYHYCFGDYYEPNFLKLGIYPSYAFYGSHSGYDPIFVHALWGHRRDRGWEAQVRAQYFFRREHADARPPRTFAAVENLARRGGPGVIQQGGTRINAQNLTRLVQPLTQVAAAAGNRQVPLRLERITQQQRTQIAQRTQVVRQAVTERGRTEAKVASQSLLTTKEARAVRAAVPRTQIVARQGDEVGRQQGPPAQPKVVRPPAEARTPQRPPARVRPEDVLERGRPGREEIKGPGRPPREVIKEPGRPPRDTIKEPGRPPRETIKEPGRPPRENIKEPSRPPRENIKEPARPPRETNKEPARPPRENIKEPGRPPQQGNKEPARPPRENIKEPARPPRENIKEPARPPRENIKEPARPPKEAGRPAAPPKEAPRPARTEEHRAPPPPAAQRDQHPPRPEPREQPPKKDRKD
jgi:hypothetical protein